MTRRKIAWAKARQAGRSGEGVDSAIHRCRAGGACWVTARRHPWLIAKYGFHARSGAPASRQCRFHPAFVLLPEHEDGLCVPVF